MLRPFLGYKLRPPPISADHLPRPGLVARFRDHPGARLTVIRAPSGFGKTTLMAECRAALAAEGVRCAWISLDGADNDSFRFTACLEAALAEIGLQRADGGRDGAEGWIALLDRLARFPAPCALFLDDFEVISDDAVLGLVRELAEALPPGARLIIGSRTPPDLALGRMRARGLLLEFEAEQLRFSEAETARFLARASGLRLAVSDLALLQERTEGWPAALRLASIAMEREGEGAGFVARFSGSEGAVAEYLAEDVLAGQPPERVAFLLKTSILRRLDPDLCDALHPPGGSAAILAGLARGNVLIAPVETGEGRTVFRYHALFGAFLRAQLARRMPEELPALHRAAARWHFEAGQPAPAIENALRAGDLAEAAEMLSGHAREFLEQGRMRLLARWFELLPEEEIARRPELLLVRAWATCFTRGPRRAAELLDQSDLEETGTPEAVAEAQALRALILSVVDDYDGALEMARAALKGPVIRSPYAAAALSNAMATVFAGVGAFDEARGSLSSARARAHSGGGGGGGFNALYADATEGIIDWLEGRIRDASARFRLALAASRDDPLSRNSGNAWAALLHASTLYEANETRRAAHLIQLHLPLARDLGLLDHMIMGYVTLSRIAFEEGDVDHAFALLGELEHVADRRQLPRAAALARLERARALTARGHLDAARAEIERADDPAIWAKARTLRLRASDVDYPELARLRLALHEGRFSEALIGLRRELASIEGEGRGRRALLLRLLEGAALHGAGEAGAAAAVLDAALSVAAREGVMRLILDEGAPLTGAIRAIAARRLPEAERRDPHFRAWLEDLLAAMRPADPPAPLPEPAPAEAIPEALAEPLEALTRREREILTLLAEGHSNAALSARLRLSDSTVRTHLRNINSKLDARSRSQAVAVARRMGLLS